MTLYIRNPEHMLENRRRWMRQMIEQAYEGERMLNFPMQMKNTADEITLYAMLPGLTTEEVSIEFNDQRLTISGEYPELAEENNSLVFNDFPAGKFSRTIELTEPVKVDKIEAHMLNGVLTIRVPKAEEAKPKTIKIIAK
jgi:HSP20 family protein